MSVFCSHRMVLIARLQQKIVRSLKLPASCYSQRIIQSPKISRIPSDNLSLRDFLVVGKNLPKPSVIEEDELPPYLQRLDVSGNGRKVFFDVYGCQMNVNDTEVVWSILQAQGYDKTLELKEADVILIVTCSIREGAETKIWNRLVHLKALKKGRSKKAGPLQIGLLGCMAERLKSEIVKRETSIDVVAGPDSYKDLPRLLALTKSGQSAINVLLSLDETYSDVMPVKLDQNSVNAYVTIMRGCDNFCSYCIVPFTRGRERSRPVPSIVREVKQLVSQGVREVTLLGQNVNSYRDTSDKERQEQDSVTISTVAGFKTVYKQKTGGVRFAELLEQVASECPELRVRFTSPHPKDFPPKVIEVISKYPNICKSLHLPAQSGSNSVLERMRRGYSREAYLELVHQIRVIIPKVALSSDFICGYCSETFEEFNQTLTLLEEVKYSVAYLFPYSMREKTTAHRRFQDDVPQDIKIERLNKMVEVYRKNAKIINEGFIGQEQLILIEGPTKRSPDRELFGRNDANIKVIVPNTFKGRLIENGDYVAVEITGSNSQVLQSSKILEITTLQNFYREKL